MPTFFADEHERLDKMVSKHLPERTRSQITKWIREGLVLLNGEKVKPSTKGAPGDLIEVTIPEAPRIEAEPIPLTIVYEDRSILVVNKPADMVVHPGPGHFSGTLVNALLHYGCPLSDLGGPERPGIVHRLDRPTSGLLVVAKNNEAHEKLKVQFQKRSAGRRYWALTQGSTDKTLVEDHLIRHPKDRLRYMSIPLGSNEGRYAKTSLTRVERSLEFSIFHCKLATGRTHQIRVHLSTQHAPILGDFLYAKRMKLSKKSASFLENAIALHAFELSLIHPESEKTLTFWAPLPPHLVSLAKSLGFSESSYQPTGNQQK